MQKALTRLVIIALLVGVVYYFRVIHNREAIDKIPAPVIKKTEEITKKTASEKNLKPGIKLTFQEKTPEEKLEISFPKTKKTAQIVTASSAAQAKAVAVRAQNTKKTEPAKIWPKTHATVFLYEWGIDFSEKVFPAGDVIFYVQNNGQFAHNFLIEGFKDFGTWYPGQHKSVKIRLTKKGQYIVKSDRKKDTEMGVVDRFVIE